MIVGNLSKRLHLEQPPQDPKLKSVVDAAAGRALPKAASAPLPGVSLAAFEALVARVDAIAARVSTLDDPFPPRKEPPVEQTAPLPAAGPSRRKGAVSSRPPGRRPRASRNVD